ncbi:MAG: S-methyl-5-thioribose-1-phosphate isomerase [Candidatus Caldatribacteriaceae bacterium]
MFKTIEWNDGQLSFLDQTLLPLQEVYITTSDYRVVAEAIRSLRLRGAPLIGVSAAYGLCLGALEGIQVHPKEFISFLEQVDGELRRTRPTAVNLFWALDRMKSVWQKMAAGGKSPKEIVEKLIVEAQSIEREDALMNERIAKFGAQLLADGDRVLTHCNAGALACTQWGTALGVIYWAFLREGKKLTVYADETRPLLQGARLTSFELQKNGIPVTVICDNMAGFLMSQGAIDKVIVGADRIALNGDFANKIGTYTVALLAHYHHIPFYIAAPLSSVDFEALDGQSIPIEERSPEEVTSWGERRITPLGVGVRNPAFDVTPGYLVNAIVTEKGVLFPPFLEKLRELKEEQKGR